HYVGGLTRQLAAKGVHVAVAGGHDELFAAEGAIGSVVLYDLVGNQDPHAGWLAKVARVLKYYAALVVFAPRIDAQLFHILWFRKLPRVERVLLPLYLKLLGKKFVFTAHNVDDRARDGVGGGLVDKLSLKWLYTLADHVFVHTERMKRELSETFGVAEDRATVVPLAINDVIPVADTSRAIAREKLGLDADAHV